MATNAGRTAKLAKLFNSVVHGDRPLKTAHDGNLFIEAICDQPDPPTCIEKIISSPAGLQSVRQCLRFSASTAFHNGPAAELLGYMQSPALKVVMEGDYLRQVIHHVVEPPIFWNAFLQSYRNGLLETDAQLCFGWLLHELISRPSRSEGSFLAVAEDVSIQKLLLESPSFDVRTMGQKIKHVISTLDSHSGEESESGPGGRHDNDFVDFREVAVHPTADEILSKDQPFYRIADAVEGSTHEDKRLAIHLDNQFRLLREDMLSEMRDELSIVTGKKKGRHRSIIVDGLTLVGVDCGDPKKRLPWGLRLQLNSDLRQLANFKPQERTDFFQAYGNRSIFKHHSLSCLITDGEIVAFPTIHRDHNQLAQKPPIVTLQLAGKASISKSLLKLKTAKHVRLVQIDTAVFAYEPVLRGLQEIRHMPLVDELLLWSPDSVLKHARHAPNVLIEDLETDPTQDIQDIMGTAKSINLDESQMNSLLSGLKQRVSLIQGPPGTGKSFIGALIAKSIHRYTKKVMLVVCYTNHALDQFLEDLLDIGIPSSEMVRLGGKSSPRTKCMALFDQSTNFKQTKATWKMIDEIKIKTDALATSLHQAFARYQSTDVRLADLLEYLEFHPDGPHFLDAFILPESEDGSARVGRSGKVVNDTYLINRWSNGENDAGVFSPETTEDAQRIWRMSVSSRQAALSAWKIDILKEQVSILYDITEKYNKSQRELARMFSKGRAAVIGSRRVVACTTTAAAMYAQELQAAARDVLLVEEAGEILESHILTALGSETSQLVLIGDHKQLRPKINKYELSVEKEEGYDLNRSLFERLILRGFPHQTLHQQHRMRPEISALVRSLTYPDLTDAPSTRGRANLRGFQDNLIYVTHTQPEDDAKDTGKWKDMSSISSKQNRFEVDMVLKCVRYLAQQGYGSEKVVVLTPYLGQLHLLQTTLSKENDPILNDLDSFDLVRAGLLPAASAKLAQRKIHLSTIDNYQGEESDIVIASLTRSNPKGDIGFMSSPERLNVLLSRARDGLIIIGNSDTFLASRKGTQLWTQLFGLLQEGGHVYEGFPVKCERHPKTRAILREASDFDNECPDGGCKEPCGTTLNCGLHLCPQSCHQLNDHSKVSCDFILYDECPKGHSKSRNCHIPLPQSCAKCDKEARRILEKAQKALQIQEQRAKDEEEHAKHTAKLDMMLADERQRMKDAQLCRERAIAIQQKEKDLTQAQALTIRTLEKSLPDPVSNTSRVPPVSPASSLPQGNNSVADPASNGPSAAKPKNSPHNSGQPGGRKWMQKRVSLAKQEWDQQKRTENAYNDDIHSVMEMIGLEEVKLQILRIKAKIEVSIRQNADMSKDRLNVVFLGNPGTGKTTVARLYSKILASLGALPGSAFVETTGASLANEGVAGAKKILEILHNGGGGAIFLDEAYQLADEHNKGGPVLDFLLAEMENNVGKIVFILAGYNKNMEKFFEHNPGLTSRIPYTLQFTDYEDDELLWMLQQRIDKRYSGRMVVEGGNDGLYMHIVVTRLGRRRGRPGFGNARALETTYSLIAERQAERLTRERKEGFSPDDFYLSKEDLIGPDPSKVILKCPAWDELQSLIGLSMVKESIKSMIDRVGLNYQRELREKEPVELSLNRVFLGSPGTGKTCVGKLYGQIMADLGILSNGEVVVKNPSDFLGAYIGHSERNTKAILATTVGKVLIIDEAYMLYTSSANNENRSDSFKTSVIDTIVAEVQGVPGDDRCVLLLGYENKMVEMFQNVNPGLSRRFAIENAFRFEDFTDQELLKILDLKLRKQDLAATQQAKAVAMEVLGRGRNRPNFGNAGEVENILGQAKARHQLRQSSKDPSQRPYDIVFEPQDFDPHFDRATHASTNLQKLFEDVVGCEDVIAKLSGYQQIAQGMKSKGLEFRGMIPTNFLFKGPPGTGKTTTARKLGQVFYDLGYLADVEIIECSASDLIGSYVGHTGPKTRSVLEKALGKVLFIDEAYRLGEGQFATEAINELTDQLTKPSFMDKLIVILAGYDKEINNLITVNPGLSSRFPEEIIFKNMSPQQCLEVLERTIQRQKVQTPPLTDPQSLVHAEMIALLKKLGALPSWGNARDMKTLAKSMVGSVFKMMTSTSTALVLPESEVLLRTEMMLQERKDRSTNLPSAPPRTHPQLAAEHAQVPAPPSEAGPSTTEADDTSVDFAGDVPDEAALETPPQDPGRDEGVPDDIWNGLQADKAAAMAEIKVTDESIRNAENIVSDATYFEQQQAQALKKLQEIKIKDEAEAQELLRKQEEARLQEQAARLVRENAKAELERIRIQEFQQRRKRQVQSKLREMGVCCQGFEWIKQVLGYRCAGGSHYVSNGQLGF